MPVKINDNGRIAGTRTTVYHVMDYYKQNKPVEEIIKWLPLSAEEVRTAIAWIESNKEHVLREYEKMLDRCARGNPPEVEERIRKAHAQTRAEYDEMLKQYGNGNFRKMDEKVERRFMLLRHYFEMERNRAENRS